MLENFEGKLVNEVDSQASLLKKFQKRFCSKII